MAGHKTPDIRLAHADSWAGPGSTDIADRFAREHSDAGILAPHATKATASGTRAIAEEPDQYRTCFERDRDRILHASAFRRLSGKTQVFVFPHDHQRTRLTHALEVAQVAVSVARALRLNVALTEAIALGHDCGHGPGGHASEDALSPYIDGGYDHAVWGSDVVLQPLNLCAQTLDGIRNHSWSRPAPSTPEGEVVSWADRIAYVCHDFEDSVAAGLVTPQQLPDIVRTRCGVSRSRQLHTFINSMIEVTAATGRIGMVPDTADALGAFRQFNYDQVYLRPDSLVQAQAVIDLLRSLVDHFASHPRDLPDAADFSPADPNSVLAVRNAVTYVGGMTDRFACRQAITFLNYDTSKLPQGIDTTM
ncbi:MAG: HD domain-containing protein [Ilumatobacteraceae bacterium]|nr:HD domain-containing protein [Ilumatobacteraceae bacterium]